VHGWFAVRKIWGSGPFCCLVLLVGLFSLNLRSDAQSPLGEMKPYAKLDREGVTYRGPADAKAKELADGIATIGVILPLSGQAQSEGKAILAAAQIALEEEQARGPLPDGRRLNLVAREESGPWGQATSEVLKLIDQDHALVVLTSANGNTAHQADQIANKISFPILTLSSDPTTTQANVPWLFRLGPSDTDQARAFCHRIYEELRLRNVLLITQADHDGRIGGHEFEKAATELGANAPARLELASSMMNFEPVSATIRAKHLDAIVMWTDSRLATELVPVIRKAASLSPIFLCQKAAQVAREDSGEQLFTVGSAQIPTGGTAGTFEQLYRARTGASPGIAAIETYHAVHLVAAGLRCVGANRVLLRDYFATLTKGADARQALSFDPAGNRTQKFAVVELSPVAAAEHHP
jgi:ABC-type branched-subunit amino acid transport system substrate-binding protein